MLRHCWSLAEKRQFGRPAVPQVATWWNHKPSMWFSLLFLLGYFQHHLFCVRPDAELHWVSGQWADSTSLCSCYSCYFSHFPLSHTERLVLHSSDIFLNSHTLVAFQWASTQAGQFISDVYHLFLTLLGEWGMGGNCCCMCFKGNK